MTRPLEKPKICGKHHPDVLAGWLLRRVSGQALISCLTLAVKQPQALK
jgi:hypothetical protein